MVYGTSAGALSGTIAALDRLDDLERFLLDLRPDETFRFRPEALDEPRAGARCRGGMKSEARAGGRASDFLFGRRSAAAVGGLSPGETWALAARA